MILYIQNWTSLENFQLIKYKTLATFKETYNVKLKIIMKRCL